MNRLGHQVYSHDVRIPAGVAQGLIAHALPLAELIPDGYVLLCVLFAGTGEHDREIAQYLSVDPT